MKIKLTKLVFVSYAQYEFIWDAIQMQCFNDPYWYLTMIKFTTCFPMVGGCPGTLAFSTTKTGHHDKAETLLKVALKHQK